MDEDETGTDNPGAGSEAPIDTSGDTGSDDEMDSRHSGFLDMLEGRDPAAKDESSDETDEESEEEEKKEPEPKADSTKKETAKEGEEDAEEDDDDELLSKEEIDKRFPTANKGLRKYAASVTAKFAPVAAAIDELGGMEAVKRLDAIQTLTLTNPGRADHPDIVKFNEHLKATNPEFAKWFQTNVFYGAIDEQPELLESVIKTALSPKLNGEMLQKIARLIDEGELDLDEIQEVADKRLPPEVLAERESRLKAEAKLAEAEADNIKINTERAEAEKQTAINTDVAELGKGFGVVQQSVWKQFRLTPIEGEPEEVKEVKIGLIKDIITLAAFEVRDNPYIRAVNDMILKQSKGDGYTWAVKRAENLYKGKLKEIATRQSRLISAYLKGYNGEASKNTKQRRPEPLADGTNAGPRDLRTAGEEKKPLTAEERRAGMIQYIEAKTGT